MAMVKEGNAKKGNRRNDPSSSTPSPQNQMDATPYCKEFEISPTCRICGLADETVSHIVSECTLLAQKDYKNVRHDKIAAAIHRNLCKKYGFEYAEKSYNHHIDKESRVLENDEVKVYGISPSKKKLDYNKPDLVILNKKEKTTHIVDVGCPFDTRVKERERTKIEKYTDLKYTYIHTYFIVFPK
ncbi:Hypothetical predicted protein [Paramuricea clavata]|uniref:Uncharacterized protein n=1 Tax=Paramuricea clavata TaxID=317549 RepID=A0A6S7H886_PARCT|nr:Hypothetical predicted protein [Paramuricea clavata]